MTESHAKAEPTARELDNARRAIADLPPPNTKRWVVRRKAQVVFGVRDGIITLEEACKRYNLSVEEFASWQRLIDQHGIHGLRVTRLREYRMVDHEAAD